jgi:multiple antibiotic resistance protein
MELSFQHYFLGLFAVANNIPAIPLFYALCSDLSGQEQRKLCFTATAASFITMMVAMISGAAVLSFFDISISAFRIAGGLLLIFSGINMVNSKPEIAVTANGKGLSEIISVAVIPIAIPLTTGAGTISTIIVFAERLQSWGLIVKLVSAILLMSFVIYFSFRYSVTILRLLGHTGMNVVTKVFGIITLALGVQFVLMGLLRTFPMLAR